MSDEFDIDANEWAGRLIDDGDLHASAEPMNDSARRQLADQLLVDALLIETLSPHSPNDRDRRMNRLLESLSSESVAVSDSPSQRSSSRRRWIASVATFSACIALMLTFWSWAAPITAEAAVEKSLRQAERPIDRHYVLTMTGGALDQTQLDLYMRGNIRSCFHFVGPLRFSAWFGLNSEQNWFVPKVGPVVVARDFSKLRERILQAADLPVQILQMADLVRFVRDDFDLTLVPGSDNQPSRLHIQGHKRPGFRPFLPDRVQLWADEETGLITRAVLIWLGPIEKIAIRTIQFELVDETPRATEWYGHDAHHEADRPIIRL